MSIWTEFDPGNPETHPPRNASLLAVTTDPNCAGVVNSVLVEWINGKPCIRRNDQIEYLKIDQPIFWAAVDFA